jgi:hypothetical protein
MSEVVTKHTNLGIQAQLWMDVEELHNRLKFAGRSNAGKDFGMLFVWKQLQQIAGKKYEELLQRLISDGRLVDPQSHSFAGNHVLGEAGRYIVQVNVSVPRREFSVDWLAQELAKNHKVPEAVTRQLVEQAKRPGNTQVRRVTITEKSAD